jgi:hypothetical protein
MKGFILGLELGCLALATAMCVVDRPTWAAYFAILAVYMLIQRGQLEEPS